jgi:hypothetical protein
MKRTPLDVIQQLADRDELGWDIDPQQLVADYLTQSGNGETIEQFVARWMTNRTLPPM